MRLGSAKDTVTAVSRGDELVASLYLIGYVVPTIVVAVRVAYRWSGDGLDRAFLGVLLGLAQAIGVPLIVAMLGVLNRNTVLAGHLLLAAATLVFLPRTSRDREGASSGLSSGSITAIGAAAAFIAVSVRLSLRSPSLHFDTRNYHLSHLADWLQGHSFWSFGFSLPAQYTVAYPSNGEVLGLWFALPTHGDQFSLLSPVLFAVLGILAVAVLTRELGGLPWIGACAGTAVFATPLLFGSQTRSLGTDNAAAAGIAAAAALIACALRTDQRRWVAAAGLGLGLGMGSKYTALVPGTAVILAAIWLLRRPRRLVWLLPGIVLFLGPWLLRNVIETGNPLFPQRVGVAGVELLKGSEYPLSPASAPLIKHIVKGRWSIVGRWFGHVGWWLGPVALLTVIGFFTGLRRRAAPDVGRTLSLVALAAFVGYLFTPFTGAEAGGKSALLLLNLRYVLPALLIGAALAAAFGGRFSLLFIAGALVYDAARILTGNSANRFNGLTLSWRDTALTIVIALIVVLAIARWRTFASRVSSSLYRILVAVSLALLPAWAGTALVLHDVNAGYTPFALESLMARTGRYRTVEVIGVKDLRSLLGRRLDVHLMTPYIPPDNIRSRERLDTALRSTDACALVVSSLPSYGVPGAYTPPEEWRLFGKAGTESVYLRTAACTPARSG